MPDDLDHLSIRVTFEESETVYWNTWVQAVPAIGATLIMDSAPMGTKHRVDDITHHIGGVSGHRIVIRVSII